MRRSIEALYLRKEFKCHSFPKINVTHWGACNTMKHHKKIKRLADCYKVDRSSSFGTHSSDHRQPPEKDFPKLEKQHEKDSTREGDFCQFCCYIFVRGPKTCSSLSGEKSCLVSFQKQGVTQKAPTTECTLANCLLVQCICKLSSQMRSIHARTGSSADFFFG